MISIVVPTLNEEARIAGTLRALQSLTGAKEIIVADGGSEDRTVELAISLDVQVVHCPQGRGAQIQAGAAQASGNAIWIVHADTRPTGGAIEAITTALRKEEIVGGNFTVVFEGDHYSARQMTWIYPYLRWIGLSYGDAGIFIRQSDYAAIGGCRPFPLFEDLDLIRRMKPRGRFVHLETVIYTSARRFTGKNYARSWLLWVTLQLLYWAGVSPIRLARWYRHAR